MSWTFGLLLDENVSSVLRNSLRARYPTLPVFHINDGVAPPLGTPDPVILEWCEANNCALVTNNRASMPPHLEDHRRRGRHVPGIFTLVKQRKVALADLVEELALLAGSSLLGEYQDQITYLKIIPR